MYSLVYSTTFKKDLKRVTRGTPESLPVLRTVLDTLLNGQTLEKKHQLHPLHGEFIGRLECHIRPDVLLIFERDEKTKIVRLLRIGSHAELFG